MATGLPAPTRGAGLWALSRWGRTDGRRDGRAGGGAPAPPAARSEGLGGLPRGAGHSGGGSRPPPLSPPRSAAGGGRRRPPGVK